MPPPVPTAVPLPAPCRSLHWRSCRYSCRLQCRSTRTPTAVLLAVLLPAPTVVAMLAPTAVTSAPTAVPVPALTTATRDRRAATRADYSAVPRARRVPYYFRRRRSGRCWPRLSSLPVLTAELPPAPVFVPLPVPTTEHISRGSSLVLISCIERTSRRRCLSQRRLSCHLQCQRPCRFLRRAGPCTDGRAATRADQRPSCLLRWCSCLFQCQPLSSSPEAVALCSSRALRE